MLSQFAHVCHPPDFTHITLKNFVVDKIYSPNTIWIPNQDSLSLWMWKNMFLINKQRYRIIRHFVTLDKAEVLDRHTSISAFRRERSQSRQSSSMCKRYHMGIREAQLRSSPDHSQFVIQEIKAWWRCNRNRLEGRVRNNLSRFHLMAQEVGIAGKWNTKGHNLAADIRKC